MNTKNGIILTALLLCGLSGGPALACDVCNQNVSGENTGGDGGGGFPPLSPTPGTPAIYACVEFEMVGSLGTRYAVTTADLDYGHELALIIESRLRGTQAPLSFNTPGNPPGWTCVGATRAQHLTIGNFQ